MRNIFIQTLIAVAVSGTCQAGVLDALSGRDFNFKGAAAPVAAVTAAQAPELKGELTEEICYVPNPKYDLSGMDSLIHMKIPAEVCIKGVSLLRLQDGAMRLEVASDLKGMTGGSAKYVYANGALSAVTAKVYHQEVISKFNDQFTFDLILDSKVSANGNLASGAQPKLKGWLGLFTNSVNASFKEFEYVRKMPAPSTGPCFTRGAEEYADGAGLPKKFCVNATQVMRKIDGSLQVLLAGDFPKFFPASYVQVNGKNYVKTTPFSYEDAPMSGYRGNITLLIPAYENGETDGGQIIVQASAGYNSDIYHLSWHDRAVTYIAGPAK